MTNLSPIATTSRSFWERRFEQEISSVILHGVEFVRSRPNEDIKSLTVMYADQVMFKRVDSLVKEMRELHKWSGDVVLDTSSVKEVLSRELEVFFTAVRKRPDVSAAQLVREEFVGESSD
ncbi:hypothetical protein K440DRAFT_638811 [Wilcoxina mikolae CBS 423.85]|nr:hypothetical protein K440DRAFT_638811 [Wilcoxina mikolae CBS 423.85]